MDDRDEYITGREYSAEQAALFERLVNTAFVAGYVGESEYVRLMASVEMVDDIWHALDHFASRYADLIEVMRADIGDRIVRGAAYIESADDSGKLAAALKRYDKLCEDLLKLEGRAYGERDERTAGEASREAHERDMEKLGLDGSEPSK